MPETTINEVLDGHVALDLECVDRIYLNAYVPNLQVGGQVKNFLRDHLGHQVPSPVLFKDIGDRFRRAVTDFAEENRVPILRLNKPDRSRWGDRKLDHVRPYFDKATRPGVVAIVQAQEIQKVFMGYNRSKKPGFADIHFEKVDRAVTVYYFYILDRYFGPGFIKLCTYFPYPGKVWLNGHEWAKRQAKRKRIAFAELSNGFASCADPTSLQRLCDGLGPGDAQAFFNRWIEIIPTPLTAADKKAGYWWELSMRQIEVSRTIVLDAPRRARAFFEALVADNIAVGRPEQITVVFARQRRRRTKKTPMLFRTRVFTAGTEVKIDYSYKKSRVKQYLKDGIAMRIETVINDPYDLSVLRRLEHLPELVAKAREVNRRLLSMQRAGQGCAIESALFERVSQPYAREGQRTGALRFGEVRAMALAGALCVATHTVAGFTNRSLRALVAGLLGSSYGASQMTYDLRRLRLHGLIQRLPHMNTYVLTRDGIRWAFFYTKVHDRVLTPLLAADSRRAPPPVRAAFRVIDHTVDDYVTHARMKEAA